MTGEQVPNRLEDALIQPPHPTHFEKKSTSLLSSMITKIGNFGVQYNYQAISIALIVMSKHVCTGELEDCKNGDQDSWVHSSATAVVFAGSIVGQLTMGYAGDVLGRSNAMGLTVGIALLAALFSAVIPSGGAEQIYATIIGCRFFLGIGLGGVYPLAATKAAEDGSAGGTNPVSTATSFFWQTPGSFTPWIVALAFTASHSMSTDLRWRLLLGLGSIPCFIVFICVLLENRQNFARTHKPSIDTNKINRKASFVLDKSTHDPRLWWKLLGTGGGWFIFDVAYYGVGLFGGEILDAMAKNDTDDVTTDNAVISVAWKQIIALSMGIPGVLGTIALMPYLSLKSIQIFGFILMSIAFVVMSISFFPLKEHAPDALFALYCFLLFALQFGPNTTTYVLPSGVYPREVRSTMNGASAACGKLGAVAGAYIFGAVAEATSFPTVMILCAVLAVFGAIVTYYFIEELDEEEVFFEDAAGLDNDEDEGLLEKQLHDEQNL
jgi:MFS transporter, PHS family, inorganic phosphate transporter